MENILPKHSAGTCDAFSALSSRRSVRAKSASSTPPSSNNRRCFQFVQYGDTLPANYSMMKTNACDKNALNGKRDRGEVLRGHEHGNCDEFYRAQ